jgi:putative CocE/NonD family hydrolase
LDRDTTLSGHVIADLNVATSERDAALFVYLSEVDSDGRPWFVTDGELRMLHRKTSACPPQYQTTWPYRSFYRKDTQLMTPNEPSQLRFALLPISWTFKAGSRIRLSISGADADHFAQVPHGRPPLLSITLGGESASFIEMPIQT